MYMKQRAPDKALAKYLEASKVKPTDSSVLTIVGILNEQAGNKVQARVAYERVVELEPNSASAANNLAWLLAEEGKDMDRALDLARRAKVANPTSPQVSDTLGWIYYKRQLYESAIPLFQDCIKKQPANAVYHFHLAAALADSGKKAQAKTAMSKALSLDSSLRQRGDVQKVLGILEM